MLDKKEFDKEGLTAAEILSGAVKGPLLDDYKKAENKLILESMLDMLKGMKAPYVPAFSGPILVPADQYEDFKKKFYGTK